MTDQPHRLAKTRPSAAPKGDRPTTSRRSHFSLAFDWAFRGTVIRSTLATALFLLVFFAITKAWKLNIYSPLAYWGDALEMASYLGRDYVFNDLRERFFAPFGIPHASDLRYLVNFLLQPNFTLFLAAYSITRDVVAALNLYYLATFPLVFVSAYWVYGRLRLSDPFRFGAATLYALMPYHFERNVGHLMESSYFLVPVLVHILLLVFTTRPFFHSSVNGAWRLTWRSRRDWMLLCALVFLSSINEYHQLFFIMLLGIAGAASAVRHRNPRILLGAVILLAAAALSVVARVVLNDLIAEPGLARSLVGAPISGYGGAERFGLKIVQVLLPVTGHVAPFFQTIRSTYDAAHEVNENSTVTLGLFGAIGFVCLVAHAVVSISNRSKGVRILQLCSLLLLGCVLIGTVGGISSVVATASAVFLGPESILTQVRSYNRIIVFIAFFSYYAGSVLLGRTASYASFGVQGPRRRKQIAVAVFVPVFALALWDQVPFTLTNSADGSVRHASDRKFFAEIETELKPASLIFQYPLNIHHVDVGGPGRYPYNYADGIRPYLNSQKLRFTFGGDNGSSQVAWLTETSALPPQLMVERLCKDGFAGILVHRQLFRTPEAAVEFETQLKSVLGISLEESPDQDFSFARLDGFCVAQAITKSDSPTEAIISNARPPSKSIIFSELRYPDFLAEVSGISGKESWGRWTIGAVAKLRFSEPLPGTVHLDITANAFGPNLGTPVKVRVGSEEKTFVITRNAGDTYRLVFATDGTADTIEIFPPKPVSPREVDSRSSDVRKIGIALISIAITP
jgi:phosphoglycerol transferase